ncbi:MAG: ATP-grasp domain-containing protein, partial [Firmicutes bacterium]|nr:ATP-grasp domain-containing protein [Bacillota bacterium]
CVQSLGYPLIVKPANLGSSIGISKAEDVMGLKKALEIAFAFDKKVVIEKALQNFVECNCAVLGGGKQKLIATEIEEPIGWQNFLSFGDKYENGAKNMGDKKRMPADLSTAQRHCIQETAKKVFAVLGCSGVARVDFLLSQEGEIFVNELNAIPGSLSQYLFSYDLFEFDTLLDKLIEIALQEYEQQSGLQYTYDSQVLNNLGNIKK